MLFVVRLLFVSEMILIVNYNLSTFKYLFIRKNNDYVAFLSPQYRGETHT